MLEMDLGVEYVTNVGVVDLYAGMDKLFVRLLLHKEIQYGYTMKNIYLHRHQLASLLCQAMDTGKEVSVAIAKETLLVAQPGEKEPALFVQFDRVSLPLIVADSKLRKRILADMKALQQIRAKDVCEPDFRAQMLETLFGDAENITEDLSAQISDQDLEIMVFELYGIKRSKSWVGVRGYYQVLRALDDKVASLIFGEASMISATLRIDPEDSCRVCDSACFCKLLEKPSRKYFSNLKKAEDGYYPMKMVEAEYLKVIGNATHQQRAVHQFLTLSLFNSPVLNMVYWDSELDLDDLLYRMTYSNAPGKNMDVMVREILTVAYYYVQLHKDQVYI